MHVRLVNFAGVKDFKGSMDFIRDEVLPALGEQPGYVGTTVSANKADGVLGILSLWQTEKDQEASFKALAGVRQKGSEVVGGDMSIESYELLLADMKQPPVAGAALMVTRFTMDPATIDEDLAFFKDELLPQIKSTPGYLGVRNMVNRTSGEGIVGALWQDQDALEAAKAAAEARREVVKARGVRFNDVSFREIVLTDLR